MNVWMAVMQRGEVGENGVVTRSQVIVSKVQRGIWTSIKRGVVARAEDKDF
jgi:hypothetical protein